jgi:DNA-binding NarL/FixJ family response regulator
MEVRSKQRPATSLWERLRQRVGMRRSSPRFLTLDSELLNYVFALAEQEQRPPEALVGELLANGLEQRSQAHENYRRWRVLSPREQEVAALACLGYSNAQIGYRLVVSPDTVKTHMRHAMQKFNVSSRKELGMLLRDWDFSAWE